MFNKKLFCFIPVVHLEKVLQLGLELTGFWLICITYRI